MPIRTLQQTDRSRPGRGGTVAARRFAIGLLAVVGVLAAMPVRQAGSEAGAGEAAQIRIMIGLSGKEAPYREAATAAEEFLARLGYTVKSIQLEELTGNPKLVTDGKWNACLAVGTKAAVWLHNQVKPPTQLAYCMVARPEFLGLSEDPPACGISTDIPLEAQVRLISDALPNARTMGMLYRSDAERSLALFKNVQASLPQGWRLEAVAVDKHGSPAEAIDTLLGKKVDVTWTAPDASVYDAATIRTLLLGAMRRKTPVFGYSDAVVRCGALLGVGLKAKTQGEQAAALVARLLNQPEPASRPTTHGGGPDRDPEPPKFRVIVNLIVAKELGLEIPPDVIRRADQVIRATEE